ncbi:MAG: WYL domain-containing protein [Micropruina sp.]|nr:WYL domain-containing protein [Micropruina sp.]
MTSTEQVGRLLALVPYLQAHPDADVVRTADTFGVTPRQLLADLNVLWYCGQGSLPGDLIEIDMDAATSDGRIRLTNADYLSRPLRFTADEVLSLVIALRAIRELAPIEVSTAVDSALHKLTGAAGVAASERVSLAVSAGQEGVRDLLARAIEIGVAVRLTYDGPTRAETSTPLVDPIRLSTRDGYAYLDAWSHERNAWRTYRLDRIARVALTQDAATEHGELPEFGSGWLDRRSDAAVIALDLDDTARWITEYYPVRSVSELPDGLRVELLVADPAWLRGLLLRLGSRVHSVSPPGAADGAAAAAAEALALYAHLSLVQ